MMYSPLRVKSNCFTRRIGVGGIALIPVLLAVVCFRKAMPIVILTMWATDTIVGRFTPSVRN